MLLVHDKQLQFALPFNVCPSRNPFTGLKLPA